jgi:hypothetical protein
MYVWLTALMDYYWQCRAWGKYETMFFARQKLREERDEAVPGNVCLRERG